MKLLKNNKGFAGKVYALGFLIVSLSFMYVTWGVFSQWVALGKADHVGDLFWTLIYDFTPIATVLFIIVGFYVMWNNG